MSGNLDGPIGRPKPEAAEQTNGGRGKEMPFIPLFFTPEGQELAARLAHLPPARCMTPAEVEAHNAKREEAAREREAELARQQAEAEKKVAAKDLRERRRGRVVEELPEQPERKISGRAVPAFTESADDTNLGMSAQPARREPPAPGRVSRRGVIGAPPSS